MAPKRLFPILFLSQPKKVKNKWWSQAMSTYLLLLPFWRRRWNLRATSGKHGWPFQCMGHHGAFHCMHYFSVMKNGHSWLTGLSRLALNKSGPWMYLCSFWQLTRKQSRRKGQVHQHFHSITSLGVLVIRCRRESKGKSRLPLSLTIPLGYPKEEEKGAGTVLRRDCHFRNAVLNSYY